MVRSAQIGLKVRPLLKAKHLNRGAFQQKLTPPLAADWLGLFM
jgi:hypothetical protein